MALATILDPRDTCVPVPVCKLVVSLVVAYDDADTGVLEFGNAVPFGNSGHLRRCTPYELICYLGARARLLGAKPLVVAVENARVRACLIQR